MNAKNVEAETTNPASFKGETLPIGILLSEKVKRPTKTSSHALPSSAYWTGGPDSQVSDSDS